MSRKRLVYSSFIHNSEVLETTQVSINRRMDKQMVMDLYTGLLHENKKAQNAETRNNMGECPEHHVE